ncbi:putative cytochrome P450 phenylacetate 2-hydroxylase [Mycena sanguinolenta]|nr:putative cytochrome P450 phenylacetate 2-hydroxylase [Mycena sanguinolenta]
MVLPLDFYDVYILLLLERSFLDHMDSRCLAIFSRETTPARWLNGRNSTGGVFRVVLGNREAVFINTHAAVAKTLVHQGAAFQSRPEFNLWHGAFSKALDQDGPTTIGTMKFSENIRRYRRLLTPQTAVAKLPSYNHFFSRRYLRLVRLLAESASRGAPCDFGYHWWTTTIGISVDQLVGQSVDDETTRIIADVNIKVLRQRNLGTPWHDYVPLVAFAEKAILVISSPFLSLLRPLRLSSWLKSFNDAENHAEELRRVEISYCQRLLRDLHQRLDNDDTTPSILGDLFRGLPEPLTSKEELLFATTLAGAGMSAGTTLTWLTGKLAVSPAMQDKAFAAIKAVYGDHAPDPLDTDRVEYIKALGIEAGRFWASIRLGFSREAFEDTVVDGIFIPKGTFVIYNTFQINRDPLRYDSPEEFIPERWMAGHYGRTDMLEPQTTKIGVPHLTHGAGRRICMGVPNVNKMLYGTLTLLLYFFKLERAPLSEAVKAEVFPSFRTAREASTEMHPIDDQMSTCDAQALAGYVGIKLTPRDPEALVRWLAEGHHELDQFDRPKSSDYPLESSDPTV